MVAGDSTTIPGPSIECAADARRSHQSRGLRDTRNGLSHRTRKRDRAGGTPKAPQRSLHAIYPHLTFALADTVVKEKVSTWLRQPFVEEDGEHHPLSPKGRGMQRAVGELLTCTRCAGTWGALVLVGLRTASPVAGRATTNVLAGANDLLQGGFRLLVERANQAPR